MIQKITTIYWISSSCKSASPIITAEREKQQSYRIGKQSDQLLQAVLLEHAAQLFTQVSSTFFSALLLCYLLLSKRVDMEKLSLPDKLKYTQSRALWDILDINSFSGGEKQEKQVYIFFFIFPRKKYSFCLHWQMKIISIFAMFNEDTKEPHFASMFCWATHEWKLLCREMWSC